MDDIMKITQKNISVDNWFSSGSIYIGIVYLFKLDLIIRVNLEYIYFTKL